MRRTRIDGSYPHCDEPVAVADLPGGLDTPYEHHLPDVGLLQLAFVKTLVGSDVEPADRLDVTGP
jgi:hypothetical protein